MKTATLTKRFKFILAIGIFSFVFFIVGFLVGQANAYNTCYDIGKRFLEDQGINVTITKGEILEAFFKIRNRVAP